MSVEQDLSRAAARLRSARDLARAGLTRRAVAAGVAAGELVRVRAGWYVEGTDWAEELPEARHLIALAAAEREAMRDRTYTHRTAATLHGLPVWSAWLGGRAVGPDAAEARVHVHTRQGSSRSSPARLVRHYARLDDADVVTVAGLRVTSVERTLYDLARTERFAVALACADHYLQRHATRRRSVDGGAWELWRAALLERARADSGVRGARGVRAVRALAALADPRAESVLESVSRLRALQMGLHAELQVPVRAERGGRLYLDFVFREAGVFGECDGVMKYTDPEITAGVSAADIFERERRRHNWVSGVTGLRGVRWGVADVVTLEKFARRMRAFGVPVSGRASLVHGREVARFLERVG